VTNLRGVAALLDVVAGTVAVFEPEPESAVVVVKGLVVVADVEMVESVPVVVVVDVVGPMENSPLSA